MNRLSDAGSIPATSTRNTSRVVHDNSGFLLPFKDLALKFVHGHPPTSTPVFDDF